MSPLILDMPSGPRTFRHLILDYTGTLSLDGTLLPGVGQRLQDLSDLVEVTVLTADTFGTARENLGGLPLEVDIIRDGVEKASWIEALGSEGVIAVGNGRNDLPMMKVAGLAVAVMGPEGASGELLQVAHVVTSDIRDALDLLLHPLRLKATLRD